MIKKSPEISEKRLFSQQWMINQQQRFKEVENIKTAARAEITPMDFAQFKLAGLMLYWAEGAKSMLVDFANSDPRLISFMMRWFREVCLVPNDKFRFQLHLHGGQVEEEMKGFWSDLVKVPISQFHKSFIKPEGTGHRKKRLYYGTLKIRICNKNLLHKIMGWIEGVSLYG
ncbi:MAG: hypothetical protein Q7T11_09455 [Deltaproteobacteria bacterium]|nr:hypothetical protein [Deltaproteobacteria bacterium]